MIIRQSSTLGFQTSLSIKSRKSIKNTSPRIFSSDRRILIFSSKFFSNIKRSFFKNLSRCKNIFNLCSLLPLKAKDSITGNTLIQSLLHTTEVLSIKMILEMCFVFIHWFFKKLYSITFLNLENLYGYLYWPAKPSWSCLNHSQALPSSRKGLWYSLVGT